MEHNFYFTTLSRIQDNMSQVAIDKKIVKIFLLLK